MEKVTVVITSCNRLKLLQRTIDSFNAMNDYPIEEFIIVEDSGNIEMHKALRDLYPNYTLLLNGKNMGLIENIDRAYGIVKTPYIFHMEDDWEFMCPGFIQQSVNVITNNHMVMQVWVANIHNQKLDEENQCSGGTSYRYAAYDGMDHIWHGFTLNPGLRSLRIYKESAPWSQWSPDTDFLALRECKIGEEYFRKGYRAAVLYGEHCIHIGAMESTWAK
jgi:GT2 family glycosyltransferase